MNNPNPSSNGYLSVAQAARALNMSERTLRRHIALEKIEATRSSSPSNGSAWLIARATVEALLASGQKLVSTDEEKEDVPVNLPAPCGEEEMPANLVLLLKRVEELAACFVALEERVAQLERELELLGHKPDRQPLRVRVWRLFFRPRE